MTLLLIGASGFVGTNVSGYLLQAGYEAHAITNKRPVADVRIKTISAGLVQSGPVVSYDAIICVAGVGDPAAFEESPNAEREELEVVDLLSALVRRHNVRRVLYLSSAGAAYGDGFRAGSKHQFSEEDQCSPVSAYGRAKVRAETALVDLLESAKGTSVTILRATNLYGLNYEKSGKQGLINALVERAMSDQEIQIYGDGQIWRDYMFAADLAAVIISALVSNNSGVYNVGVGRSHSILEVIHAVEHAAGRTFKKRYLPARSFDARYVGVSIEKAQQELAWSPSIALEDGIQQVVRHYRTRSK